MYSVQLHKHIDNHNISGIWRRFSEFGPWYFGLHNYRATTLLFSTKQKGGLVLLFWFVCSLSLSPPLSPSLSPSLSLSPTHALVRSLALSFWTHVLLSVTSSTYTASHASRRRINVVLPLIHCCHRNFHPSCLDSPWWCRRNLIRQCTAHFCMLSVRWDNLPEETKPADWAITYHITSVAVLVVSAV